MTRARFFGRNIVARGFASLGAALLLVAANAPLVFAQAQHVRWDIVNTIPPPPLPAVVSAGGMASARANDNSKITLTGTGTFVAPAGGGGTSSAATGGGTWMVATPS